MSEGKEKVQVVTGNPRGAGVNAQKRARFEIWERDENGAVHRERSLSNALYNLRTEYASFLSIRMPRDWLHVELDPNDAENVYVTRTNVNTATRIHYNRGMRFYETSRITINDFKNILKGLKGEKND